MIHSSYFKPRVYPYNGGAISHAEIDRLQELSGATTVGRTKIDEIGRDGVVGWKTGIPEVRLTLRQLEYGNMEFWTKITNQTDVTTTIDLNDFKTSLFDIAGFKTDDDGTFLGTIWYPKLRTSGFSLSIGNPDALIERNFTLVGEDEIIWSDNNKYMLQLQSTASGAGHMIVIGSGGFSTYPTPVVDPDSSGTEYIHRVLRTRSGTTTELVLTTDYTYNSSTHLLNIPASANGDVYKVYYTASSYISGGSPFTDNDTDVAGIDADSVSIYLQTSNYVYRLQSVNVDVSFDRVDVKEIGNKNVVARGIKEKTVRVTLGRILEAYTIENILRGANTSTYGKYDVRKFGNDNKLIIKVYEDDTKETFKLGYSFDVLAPTATDAGVPTKDYVTKGVTLEGQQCTISSVEGDL